MGLLKQQNKGELKGMMVTVTTEPSVEPVVIADLTDAGTNYLRVDYDTDDTLITSMITGARKWVETYLNSKLINTVLEVYWDSYSSDIILPYAPHVSITSVTDIFQDSTTTLTLDSDYFNVGTADRFRLKIPVVYKNHGLKVAYTAGYGTSASDVPEGIKTAIMRIVANMYEYREDLTKDINNNVDFGTLQLLQPYKNMTI